MKFYLGIKSVIARADGKVLVVRECEKYDEGTELGKWDVVGGRIDSEESIFDGLCREVKEESGLSIKIGESLGVTENFIEIKGEPCHIVRVYFASTVLGSGEVVLSSDHDRYEWIEPSNHSKWNLMEDVHNIIEKYIRIVS